METTSGTTPAPAAKAPLGGPVLPTPAPGSVPQVGTPIYDALVAQRRAARTTTVAGDRAAG